MRAAFCRAARRPACSRGGAPARFVCRRLSSAARPQQSGRSVSLGALAAGGGVVAVCGVALWSALHQQPAEAAAGANKKKEEISGSEDQKGCGAEEDVRGGEDEKEVVEMAPVVESEHLYVKPSDEAEVVLFACNGNVVLATEVAVHLGTQLGRSTVNRYADGEIAVNVHDNVRGRDVFVLQPTSFPPNDNLLELLFMVSALKRSGAKRVTAVVPYMAYSRHGPNRTRSSVSSSLAASDIARLLEAVGTDHVVTVDLHEGQIAGFFSVPVENVDPMPVVLPYLLHKQLDHPIIVSPSESGVVRARSLMRLMNAHGHLAGVGLLYVRGDDNSVGVPDQENHGRLRSGEAMELVGDVRGRDVVVVDDMIDSGSRMSHAAHALRREGARRIIGVATHPLLTGRAVKTVNRSDLEELVVLNTISMPLYKHSGKIRQLSVSALLAEVINRVHHSTSVHALEEVIVKKPPPPVTK